MEKTFIPLTDPKASYLANKDQIDSAIQGVLDSGWYILGENVESFENDFSDYIGVRYGTGVANGTDAIELALRASGIGKGDIVITVSHTAVATVAAIERAGAIPFMVDIDPKTFTISPDALKAAIKKIEKTDLFPRVKAIIPVHLYGHSSDMDPIMDIAEYHKLIVIEDCAQAHGGEYKGRKVGSIGHLAAFSFYPTKNLGGLGDGGIVVTDNKKLDDKLKLIRQYGWKRRNISQIRGINSRLDEIQAAILRVKLSSLDNDNQSRIDISNEYSTLLDGAELKQPVVRKNCKHVFHQYVLKIPQRDDFLGYLAKNNIGAAVHYPLPVHLQPAYLNKEMSKYQTLPVTEKICNQIISLPMHPFLKKKEISYVAEIIISGLRWL